ncbi:MAG: chorismate synthase [Acholeplasmataceae bacterium]|nr:chorismate synthase [Acholeplasmataceae bacterium]MCK9288779.1 chorismate synthase [Acholeplasmataceae bacterium]MCK9427315.1 chorismate synthase [Acholeplasmataceae bacterium]MDD4090210.1 chorismate synthase [Acholeplasmataceae bacterium]
MNSLGKIFKINIYGESHGKSLGVLIEGMPVGVKIDDALIKKDLKRRMPSHFSETKRKEKDHYTVESGVYNGYTTGTPLLFRVENNAFKSEHYQKYQEIHRPSHIDFVAKKKYHGYQNLPGSGHFSGRLTIGLVIAGALAKMILTKVIIKTELVQVGALKDLTKLEQYLKTIETLNETVGAVLKTTISNVEIGLGEPFFGGADSLISQALFSIPSIKGVSIGKGFKSASFLGSDYLDSFINEEGKTKTNHSGGIVGGITNGNDLIINTITRPISSLKKPLETFDFTKKKMTSLTIEGDHDFFIGERIKVVIENTILAVLLDLSLQNKLLKELT